MFSILNKFFNFCNEKNRNKFYKSIVCGVIMALLDSLKIPAIYLVLNAIFNNNLTTSVIWQAFGIMVASIILGSTIKYHSTMLQTEAGYETTAQKRIEIAQHLRYLPMGYFNNNSLGNITSITTNTMENLADVATRVVMLTTQGILTTLIILVMVFIFDYHIGLIMLIGVVLFFMVNSGMQKKANKLSPTKINSETKLVEKVIEYIQGISEVKSYHLLGKHAKELNKAIDENASINTTLEETYIPYMGLQGVITKITGVIMVIISIMLYFNNKMNLSVCIVMLICSFILYSSLEQAGSYSSMLRIVDLSIDKANEVLNLEPMDIDGKDIECKHYNIEINNIDFKYETRKIIDNISLSIKEKTTTAIVGPSGSGKTTLCQLIARFWDVDKGNITLDGHDIKEYSMDSLMKNFSFVFQNVYLFNDTIKNNIKFGNEEVSDDKVIEAAKKAKCHDFIMSLENGYDTIIGEGGASLSGGEKQRISIARAILKDSPIIILDEATANVDPENEKELVEAIEALTKEKTIIMIAHRLKTVRNANQIVVIDNGKIVQLGNHEELMKQDGIYKSFVSGRKQATSWKL